ncbi:hypothetical protein Z945_165 [Sulfitobacter noctilucae]|uniref:hypothetical protein n=1 Tax=Sulfitobacter noctilucae TaxID=1342302 RepID=UPI000469E7E5|nr:hypothetical protein [Sulfitobacter noctilucae]KIN75336.1 hypothetical protein Z945_165 [Sulfitobacter noctilucae]
MKQDVSNARGDSVKKPSRGLSQTIFILISLAIIGGGVWTLYMSDAPYHPQDTVTRDNTSLVGD